VGRLIREAGPARVAPGQGSISWECLAAAPWRANFSGGWPRTPFPSHDESPTRSGAVDRPHDLPRFPHPAPHSSSSVGCPARERGGPPHSLSSDHSLEPRSRNGIVVLRLRQTRPGRRELGLGIENLKARPDASLIPDIGIVERLRG